MRTWICGFAYTLLLAASLYSKDSESVTYVGKTKYLNNARAVVTHSIDDSTKYVTDALDALDKYGVKTTVFVSTEENPPPEERFFTQLQITPLWPRLQKAIRDGTRNRISFAHASLQTSRYRGVLRGRLTRMRSSRIPRRHLEAYAATLGLDVVLPLRPLRESRLHPEENRCGGIHRGAQLS